MEKKKTYTIFTRKQSDHGFSRHISLQSKMSHIWKNHETKIKSEVAEAEQSNIYWERRLGLFWKLYKELLVSLVHQFIRPSFTLVFIRNGIFKYSQKPWMRLTFRTEAVVQECSVKKVLLEISQNSQENTCTRVSFSINLQTWG